MLGTSFPTHNKRLKPSRRTIIPTSFASLFLSLIIVACTTATTPESPPDATQTTQEQPIQGQSRTGTLRVAMQPIVQTDPAFISSDSEV
ncbi:MAG TPA: hypothetical protein VJ768_05185, partial [Anaerolineales bacterium]|nr:hypothetical protein [Anaerolineales bacterium]